MKVQIHALELAFPPVSNQEIEWMKDDEAVQKHLLDSKLYMIAQRREILFEFPDITEDFQVSSTEPFTIEIVMGERRLKCSYHPVVLCSDKIEGVELEIGPKLLRFSRDGEVLAWLTPDKFLYDFQRGREGLAVDGDYRDFLRYRLHYIGISKKQDALTRLIIQPHDKRVRILSNENSEIENARLTDELVILFFRIDPVRINVFDHTTSLEEFEKDPFEDILPIIADAEKAFVKILNAQYNVEKYANYPAGSDGLYGAGLTGYSYIIHENITLTTDKAEIRGAYMPFVAWGGNEADFISIEGDQVKLVKASSYQETSP